VRYISSGWIGAQKMIGRGVYVTSPLEVSHDAENHHEEARGSVIWGCGLQTNHDIVTN